MRRILILLLLFIFLVSVSSGNWQNVGGDIAHTGYYESSYIPLELIWKNKVGDSDISAPVVDRGILFVGSDDNNLYALEAATGKIKWKYQTLGKVYTPTARDGLVFAASFDNNLYALDQDGNLKWMTGTGSSVASPPVLYNNIIYGGFSKYIHAIYTVNGSIKWTYSTDDWVESTPAIAQGMVFAGSNDKKIYAIDMETKKHRWNYTTGGSIFSSPSVVNGVIFFGSRDNKVYALDSSNGNLKWSTKTGDWVRSSPAVFDNKVFAGSNDNSIYALNADNGDVIWKYPATGRVGSPLAGVRGTIYAGSDDGTIYAIGTGDGKLVAKYAAGNGIISLALSDNMLFATSRDGSVYAFGARPSGTSATVPAVQTEKIPPVLKIDPVPVNVTSGKLKISGNAYDPGGILVVTVNGIDAGKEAWNTTIELKPGQNTITIVAVDKYGNIKTESRMVNYIPAGRETPSMPGLSLSLNIITFLTILTLRRIKKSR